jgi:hypothetical protein
VEQREDAPTRLRHLALTNAGKRGLTGFRADLGVDVDPPVTVQCAVQDPSASGPLLKAGQRRVMFCGTDWQKRVPLHTLVDAAQAVADGKARITVKPRWVLLDKAAFDLQHAEPGGYFRRPWQTTGVDYSGRWQAAALVRESSCLDRGPCVAFLASHHKGGLGELVWMGLGGGVLVFTIVAAASRLRVRVKTMGIVSVIFAVLPILALAALMGDNSLGLGAILFPILGAYLWIAWAVGFWGAWLLALPLLRQAAKRREVDDMAAGDRA